jgi:capsular exopolysaccharide synthesis family protein
MSSNPHPSAVPSALDPGSAAFAGGLEGEDLSFRQAIRILRKRYRGILLVAAVCLALVVAICLILPAQYQSTSTIELAQNQSDPMSGELGEVASSLTGQSDLKTDLATAENVFQDPLLGTEVLERLHVEDRIYDKGLPFWQKGKIPDKAHRRPLREDAVAREYLLKAFEKKLNIEEIPDSRLLKIGYKDPDKNFSAEVVNTIVDQYIRDTLSRRNIVTLQASEWMAGQLDELRKQVEAAQQKLVDFQKKSGFIAVPSMGMTGGSVASGGIPQASSGPELHSPLLDRLLSLNAILVQDQANRITMEAIYRVAQTQDPNAIAAMASSLATGTGSGGGQSNMLSGLLALRAQEIGLKQQLAATSNAYGPKNPHVTQINQQIDYLQTEIKQEDARILATAASNVKMAEAAENGTKKEVDDLTQQADGINDSAVRLAVLQQEADSTRALYEDLFTKLQEARMAQETQASNVAVISVALPSAKPKFPNWFLLIPVGIGGGLVLGVIAAFIRETLDDTIVTTTQIENITRIAVLGLIPLYEPSAPRPGRKKPATGVQPPVFADPVMDEPRSQAAEAYRSLRTTILLSQPGSAPRKLLLTSALPREGKSTTSYNLAACFAMMGKRVLLIDADMRRPGLHLRAGVANTNGLSTLLTSSANPSDVIVQLPSAENLFFLPAGITPPNPTELLASPVFGELIDSLSKQYDHVFIDSPPALLVADPVIIATKVDGVIIVVRSGAATRPTLLRVTESVTRNKANLLGFVLNAVNTESADYYHAYGYYGGSYTGKGEYYGKDKS